jgi:hypothetical protein
LKKKTLKEIFANLLTTFKNFAVGIKKLSLLYKENNLKSILKTSIIIIIILITAKTVDLLLYKHSIILSLFLPLLAGAFTAVVPEAL